ncbi:MAG: hypothetical protein J4G14_13750 [Dehalococcoidia bacterium]|nr:hypothetical protein [Dehalococcoidia bacterium]
MAITPETLEPIAKIVLGALPLLMLLGVASMTLSSWIGHQDREEPDWFATEIRQSAAPYRPDGRPFRRAESKQN